MFAAPNPDDKFCNLQRHANSHLLYTLPGSVQLEADPTVSPDRDCLGIFSVVHCAINQVALFATFRNI
jgi:hypothetical protein